jgi:hypothetical protein
LLQLLLLLLQGCIYALLLLLLPMQLLMCLIVN